MVSRPSYLHLTCVAVSMELLMHLLAIGWLLLEVLDYHLLVVGHFAFMFSAYSCSVVGFCRYWSCQRQRMSVIVQKVLHLHSDCRHRTLRSIFQTPPSTTFQPGQDAEEDPSAIYLLSFPYHAFWPLFGMHLTASCFCC